MSVYNLQVNLLQSNYYLILWYYVYGNVIIVIIIILSRINICMSKCLHVLYVLIYQYLFIYQALHLSLHMSMIILQNISGYTEEKNRSFYKRHFSIYNTMYLKLFLLYHLRNYFVITQHRSICLDLIS